MITGPPAELAGTSADFNQGDIYAGPNGNGAVPTGDWFTNLLNDKRVQAAAGSAVTALLGNNKVIQNGDGTYQTIPANQQGGVIGDQSKTASPFSMVPGWVWGLVAGIFALGVGIFAFGRR